MSSVELHFGNKFVYIHQYLKKRSTPEYEIIIIENLFKIMIILLC